jgi:hypothetical protein
VQTRRVERRELMRGIVLLSPRTEYIERQITLGTGPLDGFCIPESRQTCGSAPSTADAAAAEAYADQ